MAGYALTYIGAYAFYAQFELAPEDAGFSKDAALAHAGYIVTALLIFGLFLLLPLFVAKVVRGKQLELVSLLPTSWRDHLAGGQWRNWAALIASSGCFVMLFVVGITGQVAGERILDGKEPGIGWFSSITGVSVTAGDAVWTLPDEDQGELYFHKRVALLGMNDGMAVFYVYDSGEVLRVPSGSFSLIRSLR